ncbi:MAG TPA: hypothetical protein VN715_18280 [Roseiarcus sp.]|nr:hypothetical protein [Roseiarcus sp.]
MIPHEILLEALDAAERSATPGRPVYMLNMLRFRESALYQDGRDESPCSGREAFFERYVPAFRRLAAGRSIQRVFAGHVIAKIVAPAGADWDIAALNEYADFATFRAIVDTDAYRSEAQPHRLAALDDFRLFMLDKVM